MSLAWAAFFALAMIMLLFIVAAWVESRGDRLARRPALRHMAYTLALGVYCSSWTFYGAVGSAVRDGWNYLPIYLAPIAMLLLARPFLTRLAQAVAEEQATSVSDFIAARFSHDGVVARLVTITALLGTVPYIALQFRSIGGALSFASGQPVLVPAMIAAAALLALFALLFGARRFELAGRSEGLVYAIGLESLIKVAALVAVGAVAVVALMQASPGRISSGLALLEGKFLPQNLSLDTLVIALISAFAVIVLPRQFYMGLVEARHPNDLARARGGLAAYLIVMALVVLPIALAGMTLLDSAASPDLYVLQLPAFSGQTWIVAAALLGGISAASSMVIVDTTALATMVSNDLIFPTLMRRGAAGRADDDAGGGAIGRRMLAVRRVTILAIIALALVWALLVSPTESLASIGLVAFAAMAQFTPHLLLATYGKGRDPLAARASLGAGLALWVYTLALPPILPVEWVEWLAGSALNPLGLFGIGNASPLVHGVAWSLGVNLIVYALLAARNVSGTPLPLRVRSQRRVTDLAELAQLTASFVGQERAQQEFANPARGTPVDRYAAKRAQDLIARVVGASSARALVASALAGGQMAVQDVARLLDEGGQSLRFSRQLLAATFENIDAGISVVDADMNLVAWNSRYLDLFDYPAGLVRVGTPVAELIRFNAQRGDFGDGAIEYHVEKRLGHMQRGVAHSFERHRKDGRVIKTVGGPMPRGGYVMSFTDITEEARVRDELRRTLDELESRVADRTHALSRANHRLAEATRDKTRFLAAASHDLLQPLHAARLFTAALERDVPDNAQPMVRRVDSAIVAAEELLRALLDISKLDAGGVEPTMEPLALAPFLTDLVESFRPMAEAKGLDLRCGPLLGQVRTDPALLRSVMQNFLANAVRYTPGGGVLVGVRRRQAMLRIDVIDTGVGIEPGAVETIFTEFTRLGTVEAEGLGLGLALVERIARLLGATVEVRSTPGRGSRFSLSLPLSDAAMPDAVSAAPMRAAPDGAGRALSLLVVDNDPRIVEASIALLTRLGHRAVGAGGHGQALAIVAAGGVDAVLADYQLDDGEDGLTLIAALRRLCPGLPAALITAEGTSRAMLARAGALAVPVFAKPVSPATIEGFLAELLMAEFSG